MSFYSGLDFYSLLVVVLVPAVVLGLWKSKYLKYYRWLATGIFIYKIYSNNPSQLYFLLGYAVGGLYLIKGFLVWHRKYGKNQFVLGTVVAIALTPLLLYKCIGILGFLGISYICFRTIQVLVEIEDDLIKEVKTFQYLSFVLFFPTLSSGPIDRSRRFNEDDDRIYSGEEYAELFETGIWKLVLGAFYKVVCSQYFYGLLTDEFSGHYEIKYVLGYAWIYGMYLFFDFAGYSSMAVGTGYILGIRVPDNFNKPFVSRDMKDFWNRWHISLSTWFRDFIFNRFLMNSIRKRFFDNRIQAACAAYIVDMLIMGIWHGFTVYYVEYGLYHGLILALTEVYQKKSGFYKRNKDKKWYIAISWFVTINLVIFGFLIFSGYANEAVNVWLKGAGLNPVTE